MLLVAVFFAAWAFYKGNLSEDQRQILRWVLSLGAGFFAAVFVGKIGIEWKGLVPGLAIAASGGAAVWALTFFFLFRPGVITRVQVVPPAPLPERLETAFNQLFSLKGTNIYGGLIIGGQLLDRSADDLTKLVEVGQRFGLRMTAVFCADPLADRIIEEACGPSKGSVRRLQSGRDIADDHSVDVIFLLALPNRDIKNPISGTNPSEDPLFRPPGRTVSTSDFLNILASQNGKHTYVFADSDVWKPGQDPKNVSAKYRRVVWIGNPDASDLGAFFERVLKGVKPVPTGPVL